MITTNLQGECICQVHMSLVPANPNWVVLSDFIDQMPIWQLSAPVVMIPVAACDPVAVADGLGVFFQCLYEVVLSLCLLKLDGVQSFPPHQEVDVRVRKPRQHKLLLGVDYLCGGSSQSKDIRVRPHCCYYLVLDWDRFSPRVRRVHRVDVPVYYYFMIHFTF